MSTGQVDLSQPPSETPARQSEHSHGDNGQFRTEGTDWFAIFNITTPSQPDRSLDVDLVYSMRHDSVVCSLRFSPDGNYLATGCNHTTQVYNIVTGERICVLVDHSMPRSEDLYIRSVCFSPDGRYLATGADDGNIRIWSTHTSTLHKRLSGHASNIYSLDYSPDGRLLVSSAGDNTVRVWNTDDLHNDLAVQGEERVYVIDIAGVQVDRAVTSIAISPNNSLIAAASLENIIRIWDIESRVLVAQLEGHTDSVYSIAFSRDGTELISGSLDRTVKRWDITPLFHQQGAQTCNCTYTYLGHEDYVLCVALTHDVTNHQWVISSSKDRTVKFWDITQRNTAPMPEFTLKGHKNSVIAVDASPVGGLFATAGGDWDAKIWRYTTLQ